MQNRRTKGEQGFSKSAQGLSAGHPIAGVISKTCVRGKCLLMIRNSPRAWVTAGSPIVGRHFVLGISCDHNDIVARGGVLQSFDQMHPCTIHLKSPAYLVAPSSLPFYIASSEGVTPSGDTSQGTPPPSLAATTLSIGWGKL